MSFSITFFGPRHYWWDWHRSVIFAPDNRTKNPRVWFYRPNEHSTGGVGFCIPGLHMAFHWGREKRK